MSGRQPREFLALLLSTVKSLSDLIRKIVSQANLDNPVDLCNVTIYVSLAFSDLMISLELEEVIFLSMKASWYFKCKKARTTSSAKGMK